MHHHPDVWNYTEIGAMCSPEIVGESWVKSNENRAEIVRESCSLQGLQMPTDLGQAEAGGPVLGLDKTPRFCEIFQPLEIVKELGIWI